MDPLAVRVVTLACHACGAKLGTTASASGACESCRRAFSIQVRPDGSTDLARPEPSLLTLGAWIGAVRRMMRGETVCAGACVECAGPVAIAADAPVTFACTHCGATRALRADAAVTAPVDGLRAGLNATAPLKGSFDLTYTLVRRDATSDGTHACPGCGATVPAGHTSDACAYCGARLWMIDAAGRRSAYWLHMVGRRGSQGIDACVPLAHAERAIAPDVAVFKSAGNLFKAIGLGMGAVAAVMVLAVLGCAGAFVLFAMIAGR